MKKHWLYYCFLLLLAACKDPAPPAPYGPLPTAAQLQWHEMEMYCLIHYGVDTYTDKEWGYGDEDPVLVNPSSFDAGQIVGAAKAGGFKGVIIVAKHHDGLCLWPTKTTGHNISKSPWKNGSGDMVKEYQLACEKLGMKLGIYCSPWDRNSGAYGSPDYVSLYREQLRELYTNYGPLFISWHDGANGGDGYYGGTNEKRNIDRTSYYGWDSTFRITRNLQSSAVIFGDIGPDVRWVGNEEGHAGETCWATYTPLAPDEGKQPANGYSQYWLATEGTPNGKYWMPAECDVPLRPGWFYHPGQDGKAKSPYTLLELYYKSVGRGANLDLGIAPDRSGRLHEDDVAVLKEFGTLVTNIFKNNLAKQARITASNTRGKSSRFGTAHLTDDDRYTYWATDDSVLTPELLVEFKEPATFNVIRLRENIQLGQRITSVAADVFENGQWKMIAAATSIGSNRLMRLPQHVTTTKLKLRITGARACPALSGVGLFKEPPHLTAPAIKRNKEGLVTIAVDAPVASLHYTVDGTDPALKSQAYTKPFPFNGAGTIKAKSFEQDGRASEATVVVFDKAKEGWEIKALVSAEEKSAAASAFDDNEQTIFTTLSAHGKEIIVDMGKQQTVTAFTYLPRQDGQLDGVADKYRLYTSINGADWQEVASGEFANIHANPVKQMVTLRQKTVARYFKFLAVHVLKGNSLTVAELGVQ